MLSIAFNIIVILVLRCQSESNESHFILGGYGSLISQQSRDETGVSSPAIPVRIHKMQRSWNYQCDKKHHPELKLAPYTAVGCQLNDNYNITTNAVIFEINGSELYKWDEREARYNRIRIDDENIEILWDYMDFPYTMPPQYNVWIYVVPKEIALPPIDGFLNERIMKQDYIDMCLCGCLQITKKKEKATQFALEFIRTTKGWQGHYIERSKKNPVFKIKQKTRKQIDELMQKEFSVSLVLKNHKHNDNDDDYSQYTMNYAFSEKKESFMDIYVFVVFLSILLMVAVISYYCGSKNKLNAIYIFCAGLCLNDYIFIN